MHGQSEHRFYLLFSLLIIFGNFAGFPGTKLHLKHFLEKNFRILLGRNIIYSVV